MSYDLVHVSQTHSKTDHFDDLIYYGLLWRIEVINQSRESDQVNSFNSNDLIPTKAIVNEELYFDWHYLLYVPLVDIIVY